MRHYFSGAALAVLAIAAAQPVQAADAVNAAAVTDAAGVGLDAVVVTATKRETNLQATPIAISVVGAEGLKDRHVQSITDLADGTIPGLRVATFEARQSALTIGIRGIVPNDANQPAREQGVGVYIDGVYLGRQHGLAAALLDIDRVEVLKGPQGTLFGRNTEGGALSIVTKAPSGEFGVRTTAGVSNYGGYNADAHIDLPEVNGFSIKLDGALQYQGATTKNPMPGEKGWNYFDRRGMRAAVRWKPTDTLTIDLSYDNGYDANTPFYSQLLNYNPLGLTGLVALPPVVVVEGKERMKVADIGVPQQPSVGKSAGSTLRVGYEVTEDLELRSITAYRTVSETQWDNAGGAHRAPLFAPNGNFSRYSLADLDQRQFSQELQAVGGIPQLDYVAGLYYFEERATDDAATPSSNRWNANGTAWTINDPTPTFPGARSLDRASTAYAKSYAAFGQATYTPASIDQLHLTVGGRYTRDDKKGALFLVNAVRTNFTFNYKNNRFDPMVTLAYDAAQDVHLYAKYSTGYRAGGASSRSLTYLSFGPEEVKSYEVGAKTELFDHRLRLNMAAYLMDRTGTQVDFNTPIGTVINGVVSNRNTLETVNAPGATKIRGLDLDATLRLAQGLTATLSYAYSHNKIPPTLNPLPGPNFNKVQAVYIQFTPLHAASGSLDYEYPLSNGSIRAHLDASYAAGTRANPDLPIKGDESFIVNGRLALADLNLGASQVTFAAWARNLFDEAHVYRRMAENRTTIGDYGNFNAPRTFGAEVSVKF